MPPTELGRSRDDGDGRMSEKMSDAQLRAILTEIWGPPWKRKPKPKVVTNEGVEVRNATVKVSPDDPNYRRDDGGVVKVRRNDYVTINMSAWEEQQRQKKEDRRHRRRLDPARLGLYGPVDEDDE
jgi:hypothetical protein